MALHRPMYQSVTAWGILDGEKRHDWHKAYWGGHWRSVRSHDDSGHRLNLSSVTHWLPMPPPFDSRTVPVRQAAESDYHENDLSEETKAR